MNKNELIFLINYCFIVESLKHMCKSSRIKENNTVYNLIDLLFNAINTTSYITIYYNLHTLFINRYELKYPHQIDTSLNVLYYQPCLKT